MFTFGGVHCTPKYNDMCILLTILAAMLESTRTFMLNSNTEITARNLAREFI